MSSLQQSSLGACLLALTGTMEGVAGAPSELFQSERPAAYTPDEQHLSVLVQRELDNMLVGSCEHLLLLKLYPQPAPTSVAEHHTPDGDAEPEGQALRVAWSDARTGTVRPATAVQLAAQAIAFFGPLHGGVVTQAPYPDVIVQGRRFTTAYPHINLERYDVYDAQTREPVLGTWRARRIQNLRRETRTNRMIDIALLALEVSQAAFPKLLG